MLRWRRSVPPDFGLKGRHLALMEKDETDGFFDFALGRAEGIAATINARLGLTSLV